MDVSELRQIIEHFIEEADEGTSQLEKLFSELATAGATEQLLEKICRTARSLNGSAAALGFADLAAFTQKYENFLSAVKRKSVSADREALSLMTDGLSFIKEHVDSLRKRRKSPGKGEHLIEQIDRALQPKPLNQLIELPRQPLAGDIWFVGDDLKAELFELPEPALESEDAHPSSEPELNDNSVPKNLPTVDEKIAAIQAEIARLTILAAHVNQTTVQAAETQITCKTEDIQTTAEPEETQHSAQAAETITTALTEKVQTQTKSDETTFSAVHETLAYDEVVPSEDSAEHGTVATNTLDNQTVGEHEQEPYLQSTHAISAAVAEFALVLQNNTKKDYTISHDVSVNELSPAEDSIKVQAERIDRLIDLTGEMAIIQSILDEQQTDAASGVLQKRIAQMRKAVHEIQELSLTLRMINFRALFRKMDRIARDSSLKANKNVGVHFSGEETEIDKCVMERIADPLTQLLRFCIFNGIESADGRSVAGKPLRSQIRINVMRQDEQVVFDISDDGSGPDLEKIRSRAIERGLVGHGDKLSAEKIRALIFHRGYYSRKTDGAEEQFSESGLAQIAATVADLQGRIESDGRKGYGTSFRIFLPRTITISDGFVVKQGRERFVINKSQILESLRPHETEVHVINGQTEMLSAKGQTIPLYHLSQLLKKVPTPAKPRTTFDGIAILVKEGELQPFAVVVEQILGQQPVVNKKLGEELQGIAGLAGAAILGDGKPSLILNLCELVKAQRSETRGNQDSETDDRAA